MNCGCGDLPRRWGLEWSFALGCRYVGFGLLPLAFYPLPTRFWASAIFSMAKACQEIIELMGHGVDRLKIPYCDQPSKLPARRDDQQSGPLKMPYGTSGKG